MQEHGAYWKDLAERRIAVIFGPVFDPKGAYGMAIVEVKEEGFVHEIALKDPAIKLRSVSDLKSIQCMNLSCENNADTMGRQYLIEAYGRDAEHANFSSGEQLIPSVD